MIYVYYEKKLCRFNKKICNFNEKIIYFYDITSCFYEKLCIFNEKTFRYYEKIKKKRMKQLQSANVWMLYICCFNMLSLHVTRASHVRRWPVRFYLW